MLSYNLLRYYYNSTKATGRLYQFASNKVNADTTDLTLVFMMLTLIFISFI